MDRIGLQKPSSAFHRSEDDIRALDIFGTDLCAILNLVFFCNLRRLIEQLLALHIDLLVLGTVFSNFEIVLPLPQLLALFADGFNLLQQLVPFEVGVPEGQTDYIRVVYALHSKLRDHGLFLFDDLADVVVEHHSQVAGRDLFRVRQVLDAHREVGYLAGVAVVLHFLVDCESVQTSPVENEQDADYDVAQHYCVSHCHSVVGSTEDRNRLARTDRGDKQSVW